MQLIGKKASFIPHCMKDKEGHKIDWGKDVTKTGVIDFVNKQHGWFSVRYKAGDTVQHECFKFFDTGGKVTVHGKR